MPGALRKRGKRNLSKVKGLVAYQYNSQNDALLNFNTESYSGKDFRISLSNRSRSTRNPEFHSDDSTANDDTTIVEVDSAVIDSDFQTSSSWAEEHGRAYFLDKATMSRLRLLVLLGASSGAFPWRWNKVTGRIELWSEPMRKLWLMLWIFYSVQLFCLTPFQIWVFYRVNVESQSYREVFMKMHGFFWYMSAFVFNLGMGFYRDQIREYINTLLEFNKEWTAKYLIDLDGFHDNGRLLISVAIPINMWQGVNTVLIFLAMPYQRWYLMSYIYPKPWYWLIPGAMQDWMVVGQTLAAFTLFSWVVVAHSNSANFWLQETYNQNDSGHTLDTLRNPSVAVETYKALQVLCTVFNCCMAPIAIAIMKFHVLLGLLPCGFIVIRSMNDKFLSEFPAILTYPIGLSVLVSGMSAVLSLPGTMNDLSMGFVHSWSFTQNKPFRRMLLSCPALKLKVSSCYALTLGAFVTFFQSAFDMLIDCIITLP